MATRKEVVVGTAVPRVEKDLYGEQPERMTYTEQANKRAQCGRLTWLVIVYLWVSCHNIFLAI